MCKTLSDASNELAKRVERTARGPQEAVKALGKLSISPLSYTCILAWAVDWLLEQGRRAVITYIVRMEEHRVTRQVLLQCVKPAPESLFGDVPDLDVYTAINLAMNRVEWKEN